tara:strand:- start:1235 stop:1381 length:147 start_codon:yes stop_codon:yes gene_type:complete
MLGGRLENWEAGDKNDNGDSVSIISDVDLSLLNLPPSLNLLLLITLLF